MTDTEKKARAYAELHLSGMDFDNEYERTCELDNYRCAFLAGAAYALAGQWRDAEKELPEWNKDVVVACQVPNESEIEYCVGYHNRGWHLEDEYLDAIGRILAWLPIPEYKPKGE